MDASDAEYKEPAKAAIEEVFSARGVPKKRFWPKRKKKAVPPKLGAAKGKTGDVFTEGSRPDLVFETFIDEYGHPHREARLDNNCILRTKFDPAVHKLPHDNTAEPEDVGRVDRDADIDSRRRMETSSHDDDGGDHHEAQQLVYTDPGVPEVAPEPPDRAATYVSDYNYTYNRHDALIYLQEQRPAPQLVFTPSCTPPVHYDASPSCYDTEDHRHFRDDYQDDDGGHFHDDCHDDDGGYEEDEYEDQDEYAYDDDYDP